MIEYSNPNRDIYVFPSTEEGKSIVYSPLRGVSLFVSNTAANQIIGYFQNSIIPESPTVHRFLLDLEDTAIRTPNHENDIEISDKAVFYYLIAVILRAHIAMPNIQGTEMF